MLAGQVALVDGGELTHSSLLGLQNAVLLFSRQLNGDSQLTVGAAQWRS
jgi:hypothetical protein